MSTDWILLIVYVSGALSISFLCSVLEATLLSARTTELADRAERGDRGAAVLLDLKRTRIDDAISAILTLNTIAHTIGAALAGATAARIFGDAAVGVFSAVLTVLVLICTEIIPKTLGTVHASKLVGFVGRTVVLLTMLLWLIVRPMRALTRLLASEEEQTFSRGELAALVSMATSQGALAKLESSVFENVLRFEKVRVEDVMTPRTVVVMQPAERTLAEFAADPKTAPHARFPVYRADRDHVIGFVLQREVLRRLAAGGANDVPLSDMAREILILPESTSLAKALRRFLDARAHLAIAVDEFGGVAGLVTLEDVIETILGVEIVDESDRHVDMREAAAKLRDRRLARQSAERGPVAPPSGEAAGAGSSPPTH